MTDKPKKQITDIKKPGNTPAAATSRPIIVGHGSPLKDPMVTSDTPEPTKPEEKVMRTTGKTVQPLSEPKAEAAKESTTDEKPAEESAPTSDAAISDQAVVDAVVERAGDKKKDNKEAEELHKRLEHVEKLVDSKKYFVPIDVAAKKRTHRIELALTIIFLLVVGGALYVIDAGLIETSIKLPFDLVK